MTLSGDHIQAGSHLLISDIGLTINDSLQCWTTSRVSGGGYGWYHTFERSETIKLFQGINNGWYSSTGIRSSPYYTLTRTAGTPATEGILTCRHMCYFGDRCSVSVEVHHPSEYLHYYCAYY